MRQRKLVIGLLIMVALVVSTFTFAFWAGTVSDATNNSIDGTITIGTGQDVTTAVVVNGVSTGQSLVPTGRIADSVENDATESVVLSFEVAWTASGNAANGATGTLSAVASNIAINGNTTLGEYANVSVVLTDGAAVTVNNASTYTVTVTVTLDEPTITDYPLVAGMDITFDLVFSVDSTLGA